MRQARRGAREANSDALAEIGVTRYEMPLIKLIATNHICMLNTFYIQFIEALDMHVIQERLEKRILIVVESINI